MRCRGVLHSVLERPFDFVRTIDAHRHSSKDDGKVIFSITPVIDRISRDNFGGCDLSLPSWPFFSYRSKFNVMVNSCTDEVRSQS